MNHRTFLNGYNLGLMAPALLLVCDDAGYASVDRGIRALAEATGVPLCADYLIEAEGAVERARKMSTMPGVSIGLHFEWSGMSDADRVEFCRELALQGQHLGEQSDIRQQACTDARRQLALFREALGRDPAHISTHGNFNVAHGRILPWWEELMAELFNGAIPPMQLQIPHVRHNLYTWNLPEVARPPRTPSEFASELAAMQHHPAVEFVMHPALPAAGDASLEMLFTAEMRIADLEAAVAIMESGVIRQGGFEIVAAESLGRGYTANCR